MSYQKKLKETLPLLSSFGLLIIIGVVIFSFSKVDAALITDTVDVPSTENIIAPTPDTNNDTTTTTTTTADENEVITAQDSENEFIVDNQPYIEATESGVYQHAYFAADQDVAVQGTFENDVFAAGNTVTISGVIEGDVFAAGNTVTIDATVKGSVWVAGNNIVIQGDVKKNVMAFGSSIRVGADSSIGQDLTIGAAQVTLAGNILGQVSGGAEQMTISGKVGQAVNLDGVNKLTIDPAAWIGGNLTYSSEKEATVPTQTIGGDIQFTQSAPATTPDKTDKKSFSLGWFLIKLIVGLIGYLLLGLVLIKTMPKKLTALTQTMLTKCGISLGYGLLYLLVMPLVILVTALTLIGLPLAAVTGLLFILTLFVAKIAVGLALGQKLLSKSNSLFAQFALGFSLIYLVVKILSQTGFIIHTLMSLVVLVLGAWATGAMILQLKHKHE